MTETQAWRGSQAWLRAAARQPAETTAAAGGAGRLWALLRAGTLLDGMPGPVELAEDDHRRMAARTSQRRAGGARP